MKSNSFYKIKQPDKAKLEAEPTFFENNDNCFIDLLEEKEYQTNFRQTCKTVFALLDQYVLESFSNIHLKLSDKKN